MSTKISSATPEPFDPFQKDLQYQEDEIDPALLSQVRQELDVFEVTDGKIIPKENRRAVRSIAGKLAVDIEGLKHGEVGALSLSKEEAIHQIEKIHDFLSLAIWKNDITKDKAIFMDEEPMCTLVNDVRAVVGTGILPEGVYMWKGLDQVEGLRASLQTRIQDITAQMSVYDMRIGHILEQTKQMLDSLRKIADMEQQSTDSIIRKSSKSAGG